jgi:type I restriction enzyme R subunit
VPMVEKEMALIQEIQTDAFWQDIAVPILETVRRRPPVYTDFEDNLVGNPDRDRRRKHERRHARFRMKARQFLRANENHIAIKLRRNDPLTATDLAELERLFVEAGAASQAALTWRWHGHLPVFRANRP